MGISARAPARFRRATPAALGASVFMHVAMIAAGAHYLRALTRPEPTRVFEIALADALPHAEVLSIGVPAADAEHHAPARREASVSGGPLRDPRPDTGSSGRGGSKDAAEQALHMSDSVDGLTLETDPTEFSRSSQLSRIDTSDERRSREDRRTTPMPMELTFIATGPGKRVARLEPARSDPAAGALGATPIAEGQRRGDLEPSDDGFRPSIAGAERAGAEPSPARGVDHGTQTEDYRRSAAVTVAHPSVREGRASISTTRRGRPSDTADSSQAVASLVQSLISASTAGGTFGKGPGGKEGGADPGSGGLTGAGLRAQSSGDGGFDDAPTLGLQNYAAALTRKVYPFWEEAFPSWARAEGRGGVAVIGVTLWPDGSVHDLQVVRGSGYPEFDRNVALALEQASPYGPLPRALRQTGLTLHIAFDAMNPAVGRAGPGPGKR